MFSAGQQLGRYTLVKQLGKGAYGEVWLAMRHAKFVTTKVAVKLPLTSHVDFDAIRQEAILWEQASGHPNVLPIIEADEFEGQVLIVSEYASDGTLDEYLLRAERLPIRRAVEIALGIAQGLEFLHSRRIVHRDIKPANVLLQGDTPRLTDFGMSRVVLGQGVSMQVSGTPYYMAPEAFSRKRDRQTDIWSFGVVLYEMLTGGMPFPGDEVDDICHAVLNDKPLPMPKSIPRALRDIVLKTLQKNPADRYQSVTEIREALQKLVPDLPDVAAESNEFYDYTETPDRSKKHSNFKRSQFVPEKTKRSRARAFRKLAIAVPLALLLILAAAASVFYVTRPDPIPFRRGDKFGYLSWNRKAIAADRYDLARPFADGRALVGVGAYDAEGRFRGKYGFIDRIGNEVIPPVFDDAGPFSEGRARVAQRGESGELKYGFIDASGSFVVSPSFDEARDFANSLAPVKFQGKWGYIDPSGTTVIPFSFDDAASFSDGLATVKIGDRYGFVNTKGEIAVKAAFEFAGDFSAGKAPVKRDGRAYFIDTSGNESISRDFANVSRFSEGLAMVTIGGKSGFIDANGNQAIPFTYECDTALFSEGAAAVPLNGKFGYINRSGAQVIPFRYREAGPFKGKLALVRSASDGREFYIGVDGTEYFEP